jgi:hypothetical protein
MPDMMNLNPEMQQYFSSLPIFVQETIKQSNVNINCVEDLRKCAENLMSKNCNQ